MSRLSEILQIFAPSNNQQLGGSQYISRPRSLKLNFRSISAIDKLPEHLLDIYRDIEELSLNHNELRSLDGIQQFQNLKRLKIQSN